MTGYPIGASRVRVSTDDLIIRSLRRDGQKDVPRVAKKRCPACGSEKPVSEFSKAVGKPDGYRTLCRECDGRHAVEYAQRIADRDFAEIKPAGKKMCCLCHRDLPVDDFNYCRSHPDGLKSHCLECGKEYKQRHYEKNRADYENRADEYRRKYHDRRKAYAAVDAAVKRGELIRPETCSRCGKNGTIVAYHGDYDEPLEVVWLCLSCNRQIHADLRKGRNRRLTPGGGTSAGVFRGRPYLFRRRIEYTGPRSSLVGQHLRKSA